MSDPESPTVRVVSIICGTVVVLAVIVAIIVANARGNDTGTLYALATGLVATLFPAVVANRRVTELGKRVDRGLARRPVSAAQRAKELRDGTPTTPTRDDPPGGAPQ